MKLINKTIILLLILITSCVSTSSFNVEDILHTYSRTELDNRIKQNYNVTDSLYLEKDNTHRYIMIGNYLDKDKERHFFEIKVDGESKGNYLRLVTTNFINN